MKRRARKQVDLLRPLPFKPSDFIARTQVFRRDEFAAAHLAAGRTAATVAASLAYHVAQGHLVHVRRGLYARWGDIDPWLIASRLTADAVIGWEGALTLHGFTSLEHHLPIQSVERIRYFSFGEVLTPVVQPPAPLRAPFEEGVETVERAGLPVSVTTRERTLVDCLDRLDLHSETPEMLLQHFLTPGLDVDVMIGHALALSSATTIGRTGLMLSARPDVTNRQLARLEGRAPRAATYFDRSKKRGERHTLVSRWNLIIPRSLLVAGCF